MNLGQLIATLTVSTTGLAMAERDMRRFETRMGASVARINKRLATTGAAMKKFGRGMTMYMTAPLALVGGAAFKMHMDFESSMSKIVGLVGVASEQVNEWSKDILEMAPRLAKSPQELADALFFVTSAGLRGAEAMDVLEMSAKASAGGLGETKVVADLATSAMNAYGSAVLNAEQAVDIMVATVREGKAEAAELTATMGMVLPIASNMGVAFHEVGAAVAAMTRTGTKAATASMQLRQILASLLKPTEQSKQLLEDMGTSAEQVEAGFKAMGTSASYFRRVIREQGLLAALMEIKDLSAKFGEEAMSTVFPNIRALSGVLDILGENLEDNIALFKRMGITTDSLNKLFEVTSDTTKFKFNQAIVTAKTSLTILGKTVSEAFLPILKSLAEKLQKLTDWFTGLSDAERQQVVRIAGIVAAIGPLLMILGPLLGGVSRLITVGYGAIKMFNALRLAMMANPALAIAAGITILVAAIIQFTKKKKEATDAQLEFNKALEDEEMLMGDIRSIEARMSVLETLNKRQVEDLIQRLESQIKVEEDYTAKLLAEAKARGKILMTADQATALMQKVSNSRYKLTEEETTKLAAFYASERTKRFQEENMKRLDDFAAYLLLAKLKWAKFKDETKVVVPAIPAIPVEEISFLPDIEREKYWFEIEYYSLLREMSAGAQAIEGENQRALAAIKAWYRNDEERKEREAASAAIELFMAKAQVMESIGMLGIALADRQIAKLDKQYRKDITAAGENAKQKIKIEEAYNKKRGDLLRKAAIAEKLVGIFSIAISTAKGVMDAMSKVVTMPLVPWIIAAGAIQAAIVAAQPIPALAEGAIVTRPTLAMIGENYKPEAVIPLGKLNQQPIKEHKVKFIIEQDQLVGILQLYDNQKNNF